jgi:hypothetical protein
MMSSGGGHQLTEYYGLDLGTILGLETGAPPTWAIEMAGWRLENGYRYARPDTIRKIVRVLDLKLRELLKTKPQGDRD